MHLENFDLNLLVALEALMRRRSVTAASDELHISQSALSSALNRARRHFSDDILYYDGQQMVPTPFGRDLEALVPDMIGQLRSISRMRAHRDLGQVNRRFSVVASDYVAAVYVSKVSRVLSQVAPGVTLAVLPFAPDTLRQFQTGAIDFTIGPAFSAVNGVHKEPLFNDRFLCALWQGNPVLETGLTEEAYFGLPHILTNFFLDDGKSHFERWLDDMGQRVEVAAYVPSFVLLPHFVHGTRNVATIHSRLKPQFAGHGDLVFVEPPRAVPLLCEYLFTHGKHGHDTEARMMRDVLLEVGRDMPAIPEPSDIRATTTVT